jgi:YtkA-like
VSASFLKPGLTGWLAGIVCAATLLPASCSRPVASSAFVAIEYEISPKPIRVGSATIILKLSDASGKPVTGAHIALETDMSHAGMSPGFAEAKEAEAGSYKAQLKFQMAGDWVILLHGTLLEGTKLERQIDVRGVRPD